MRDPNSDVLPEKPIRFDEMKKIAAVLSKGLPHLRVDFYCANGKLYVGELTFYHCSGFAPIQPEEWAIKMGETQHIFNAGCFTDVQTATARNLFDVASSGILDKFVGGLVNKCRIHNVISFRG